MTPTPDQLRLEDTGNRFWQDAIEAVALASNGGCAFRIDIPIGIPDRERLGGFNRWAQHREGGCCDGDAT